MAKAPEPLMCGAGGRPTLAENRKAILDALADGFTMRSAARRGGISQRTLYDRLGQDADFAAEVAQARKIGRERRADELGEKLFESAETCATDPRFTTACIFALKNLDPQHWR
jgi:transposase